MPEEVKCEYHGITITYNESTDVWLFTLRGRDRSAETLLKAKEYIDRPVKSTKANTFTRTKVMLRTGGSFVEGEVTSIAGTGYRGRAEAWVSYTVEGRAQRAKYFCNDLYPINPVNMSGIERIRAIDEQRAKLNREREAVVAGLKPYVPPEPESE